MVLDLDRAALRREHVAGRRVAELRDRGEVAGLDLGDRLLLLAAHHEQLVHALVGAGAVVGEHLVVLHRSLHDAEQVDPADVGVDDRLEHERGRRALGRLRCRRLVDEEAHEPVDADELRRAAAQHREHRALRDAARERGRELRRVDRLVVEVPLHEFVVADDDALDERVVHRVLLVLHLGRDGSDDAGRARAVVADRVVGEELDDSGQRGLLTDRELQRRDARAEALLQLIERARERRALAIELVDEDRARHVARFGHLPRDLGLHLDAFDRGDDEQREVGRLQRGRDIADEVGVTGCVDHVDLVPVVLERRERERHGDAPPLLFGIEVARGVVVLDPAQARYRPGGEQHGFGEGGLACTPVADEGDVAELRGRERFHKPPCG